MGEAKMTAFSLVALLQLLVGVGAGVTDLDCSRGGFLPKNCNTGNDWTTVTCQTDALDTDFLHTAVDEWSRKCLAATTSLTTVCTSDRRATFSSPAPFSDLPSLAVLEMSRCCVSEIRPADLAGLDHLEMVEFDGAGNCRDDADVVVNPGTFLRKAPNATQLIYVAIMGQGVRSVPPETVCGVQDTVDFSGNRLTDVANMGLANSSSSCGDGILEVYLSNNQLTSLPDGCFGNLTGLLTLNLDDNLIESIAGRTWTDTPLLSNLHLSGNRLNTLDSGTFSALSLLRRLTLDRNRLAVVDEGALDNLTDLQYLSMRDNLVGNVSERMWRDTTGLKQLHLSGNRLGGSLERSMFGDMDNLTTLDLNGNRLATVDSLARFPNLLTLNLSGNAISYIERGVFRTTLKLKTLSLAYNRLTFLSNNTFLPLYALQVLNLEFNDLSQLETNVFRFCPSLTNLSLHHNQLTVVPNLSRLTAIKELHLSDNAIESLPETYLTRLTDLRYISLSNNRLTVIPDPLFSANAKLETLHLSGNRLTDLWNMTSLKNLYTLELQNNSIAILNLPKLRSSIRLLNVSGCRIGAVTGRLYLTQLLRLTHLDLSDNELHDAPLNFAFLIEYNLSRNKLFFIAGGSFASTTTMAHADLRHNPQLVIKRDSLLVANPRAPTSFLLEGVPFRCDCHTQWLRDANVPSSSGALSYGTVGDLERVQCTVPVPGSSRESRALVVRVTYDSFLCEFGRDTLPTVPAGSGRTGDTDCPERCRCYVNRDWTLVVTYCSSLNLIAVPSRMPNDSVHVYLDGNDIGSILKTDFVNVILVTRLYLNGSGVEFIQDGAFATMTSLTILRLDDNRIVTFSPDSFAASSSLQQLHLQRNRLTDAKGGALFSRLHATLLRLDDNSLTRFPPFDVNGTTSVTRLTLSGNPWLCECSTSVGERVSLLDRLSTMLVDRNQTTCSNVRNGTTDVTLFQFYSGWCRDESSPFQLAAALVPVVALLVVGMVAVLLFVYRYEMQVLLYSRYNFRLSRRSEQQLEEEDSDKIFDAFVAYSELDEKFVVEELVPRLEGGDLPFRLCLHKRNFLVGGLITNSIMEAVECSRRTIVVMSNNFIESSWCRFEFKTAHVQTLEDRRNRLIMVVLDDIVPDNLDPEAKLYFKTNIYLKRSDRLFWEKLEFSMPRRRDRVLSDNAENARKLKGLFTT